MKCPRCNVNLIEEQLESIKYHKCDDCEGLWMFKSDLNLYLDKDINQIDESRIEFKKSSKIECPSCLEANVELIKYKEVEIDLCKKCEGVWLDKNELGKLMKDVSFESKKNNDGISTGAWIIGEIIFGICYVIFS